MFFFNISKIFIFSFLIFSVFYFGFLYFHFINVFYIGVFLIWTIFIYLGTPGEKTGDLMVFVAKFIDCPKRQQFPWGSVQVQAALTLGEFLGLSDIHLLQNSLLEVLRIILNFPMVDRVRSMTSFEDVQGYLETMAKVLLEFNLEFADVVVACSEKPETKGLLVELVKRLRLLADPFPERQPGTFCEQAFSKDAIIAFSELSVGLVGLC